MAGRTTQPITYLIDQSLAAHPRIQALEEKGHALKYLDTIGLEVILSPIACRMTTAMLDAKYGEQVIEVATKAARAVKRGTK